MLASEPLWYKDAIIYELHVRSYFDSVDDGIGDFRGLTQKLDYLEDLGVTVIWVLPFYPSPLKDDGYDIADYMAVNPQYGKLEDFKHFLDEAHRHGMRVITELVINHTSDQHPWFQRARRSPPGSPEREYYVWSDTPEKYGDACIMFPDFETSNWSWDPIAKQYYWHRFYSHQPDLNYDNPAVWQALMPVLDFWFGMGVDGMRLDAVPYLFEREGTTCEHLPETHAFLKALRKHVDERFPDRMFLAEANAWPEEAVKYFGDGDECHMAFHFPLMPRLFMALHQEDRFPIIDIFAQTPPIPENAQWCLFLRNHDELTLAMVTDEERDYMYRAYAQDRQAKIFLGIRHRLAPLLKNDRRRIEMMNALLFSLPGTPVIYYGDEIGMGDNIYLGDRNGVRTPMQWSADRNAGFSRANPQKLFLPIIIDPEYHYESINVEAQQGNPSSLLWWMKRLIALRKRHRAFGRGGIEFLEHTNPKVLAYYRVHEHERLLVVVNLSRFVQHVELDLSPHAGSVLEESFGGTVFPQIQKSPYPLSLGPHGFYWFAVKTTAAMNEPEPLDRDYRIPEFAVHVPWEKWIEEYGRGDVEELLPIYLYRRGIVQQAREILMTRIVGFMPLQLDGLKLVFLIVRVAYRTGLPEYMPISLTLIPPDQEHLLLASEESVGMARLVEGQMGLLCAALAVPKVAAAMLLAIGKGQRFPYEGGELAAHSFSSLVSAHPRLGELPTTIRRSERHNLSVTYGNEFVLKVLRRMEEGVHPDVEVTRHLVEQCGFTRVAPVLGTIEMHSAGGEPKVLAILHQYVPNQGTAWQAFVHHLGKFYEELAAQPPEKRQLVPLDRDWISPDGSGAAGDLEQRIGTTLDMLRLLGKRTAEMHQALALPSPAFAPVAFNRTYQRAIYQGMRTVAGRLETRLGREASKLQENLRGAAEQYLSLQPVLDVRFDEFLDPRIGGMRIRTHGDYHLGQLFFTGNDFVVMDFEGEPERALSERRLKRSPLRDVATMVRSLDQAASSVLMGLTTAAGHVHGFIRDEDKAMLQPWADWWVERHAGAFIQSYLLHLPAGTLLPSLDGCRLMLELYLLEHSLLEIEHDLTNRPAWAIIPLRYVLRRLVSP